MGDMLGWSGNRPFQVQNALRTWPGRRGIALFVGGDPEDAVKTFPEKAPNQPFWVQKGRRLGGVWAASGRRLGGGFFAGLEIDRLGCRTR